ncbi:MAG TPA: hypothetical protein VMT47_11840 [Polyangia bacterium]|nr:hypothetical protein [Polyangia bacterium]
MLDLPRLDLSILALALVSWAPAMTGCGLVSFDVDENIPAQTIMGSPIGALVPATLFALPLDIDISAATAAHGTGPAKSANLSALTFTIDSPADGTFDFLSAISVSVSASGGGALPEVEIAKLQPVPGTKTISIPPVPGVDLLPYIKAGASIKATASGHLPVRDTTVTGTVVVTVHV